MEPTAATGVINAVPRPLWAKALSLVQFVGFCWLPTLAAPYWPQFLSLFPTDEQLAYALSVSVVHIAMLLFGNVFFALLYWSDAFSCHHSYKIAVKRWPWQSQNVEEVRSFWLLMYESIGLTLFNNLVLALPLAYLNFPMAKKLGYSADVKDIPSPLVVMVSLLAFVLIEDLLFYIAHRSLHLYKPLYRAVHKRHHLWTFSLSIAAEASHPFEFLLANATPFAAGPLLLGAHLSTMLTWMLFRIGETLVHHSGYEIPFSVWKALPFAADSTVHDLHHSENTGNYGSFLIVWDTIFGTTIDRESRVARPGAANAPVSSKQKST